GASAPQVRPATLYPPPGSVPPTNSSEVQHWLKELDLSGAPDICLNQGNPPQCDSIVDPNSCHWSCHNCAADDVVTCPDLNIWGLSFDDGPTNITPDLLEFLQEHQVRASFFLIGGNVVLRPDIVYEMLTQGHHIASHTWSHKALTTLTNEEIVAEVKWTEKAIEDVIGYRVKYLRPPYGDIDDRVRFVLKKMGYIVVDWGGDTFDVQDWRISGGQVTPSQVIINFEAALDTHVESHSYSRGGFISLEHDVTVDTFAVAKELIPYGLSKKIDIQPIAKCLHDARPYQTTLSAEHMPVKSNNSSVNRAAHRPAIITTTTTSTATPIKSLATVQAHKSKNSTQERAESDRMAAKIARSASAISSAGAADYDPVTWLGAALGSLLAMAMAWM
ncbi:chitin deacetylase, partial [Dissophora globulifera]